MMDNVQMIRGQAAQIQMEKKLLPAMSRLSPLWSVLARAAGCSHGSSSPELVGSNTNPASPYNRKTAPNMMPVLQDPSQPRLSNPSPVQGHGLPAQGSGTGSSPAGFLPHLLSCSQGSLRAERMMSASERGQGQPKGRPWLPDLAGAQLSDGRVIAKGPWHNLLVQRRG